MKIIDLVNNKLFFQHENVFNTNRRQVIDENRDIWLDIRIGIRTVSSDFNYTGNHFGK